MYKFILLLALIGSAHAAAPITVIGHDGEHEVIGEMTPEEYSKTMVLLKDAFDDQVVNGLASYQDRGPRWQLQKFSLGIGVNGEIGIGPFKFAKALKQRFFYAR